MNVGQYLKGEREAKNIPIGHIADITKISINYLNVIEAGRFDRLPSKVFAKGFVKSYAKCLGLNVDEVMLRFENSIRPVVTASSAPSAVVEPHVRKRFNIHISKKAVFFIIAALVVVLSFILSSR